MSIFDKYYKLKGSEQSTDESGIGDKQRLASTPTSMKSSSVMDSMEFE